MTPTRLLLVTDAVGGVWVYSIELARALKPLAIETILAVMGPSPTETQREQGDGLRLVDTGLPLEWLDTNPDEIARAGHTLAKIARREGADVVQTCSAALLADAHFEQPCVAVQHSCVASWWAAVKGGALPSEFVWRRELVECGLKRAAAVVAPSIAFAAETSRIYDVHALTVHNGRERMTVRQVPQGQFVFTAGRLWDEGKNAATLDAAAARLGVPFQAAGPSTGPNGTTFEAKHLQLLGAVSEKRMRALVAARPVYASAALYEPFGLSVLEAARAGCALVLSDIPTHRELWEGAALFVGARDNQAFASAIEQLLGDPDARERRGALASSRALHFSPERMAGAMASIYERVLDQARLKNSGTKRPMMAAGAAA